MEDFINVYREMNKLGKYPNKIVIVRVKYLLVLKIFGAKNKNQLLRIFKSFPELKSITKINILV